MMIHLEGITMRNPRYFDTFPETIAAGCANSEITKVLAGIWNAPVVGLVLLWKLMLVWQRRTDMREQLGSVDRHVLTDMGIKAVDARREASKPFWRA
jgi:uncharacterized protein YjiS (DUF1127 family)